jgi:hypothetical protein
MFVPISQSKNRNSEYVALHNFRICVNIPNDEHVSPQCGLHLFYIFKLLLIYVPSKCQRIVIHIYVLVVIDIGFKLK